MEGSIKKCCEICKSTEKELNLCSKCKVIYYCGIECQAQDWPYHKRICYELKEIREWEPKKVPTIDHFTALEMIGEGNFSEILKATHRVTKNITAIKRINKFKLSKVRKEQDINMEKHCLGKLKDCKYVIDIYFSFQDELNYYINFEYVSGGELWELCKVFGLISISKVKFFFAQLILALEEIHGMGIIHRDIKPENILLMPDSRMIKFVDFGTARDLLDPTVKGSGNSAKGKRVYDHFVGTPNFMPPEAIHNKGSNEKTDIWALGGTIYHIFSGFPPLLGASEYIIFKKALEDELIFEDNWNSDLKELIQKMMKKDSEERISLAEIKNDKFFQNYDFENLKTWEEIQKENTKIEEIVSKLRQDLEGRKFTSTDEISEVLSNEINKQSEGLAQEEKDELFSWNIFLSKRLAHINKFGEFEY